MYCGADVTKATFSLARNYWVILGFEKLVNSGFLLCVHTAISRNWVSLPCIAGSDEREEKRFKFQVVIIHINDQAKLQLEQRKSNI